MKDVARYIELRYNQRQLHSAHEYRPRTKSNKPGTTAGPQRKQQHNADPEKNHSAHTRLQRRLADRFTPAPDWPACWVGWSRGSGDQVRFGDFELEEGTIAGTGSTRQSNGPT